MATSTRTIIGPNDHGRKMAFDDFVEAEFEEGISTSWRGGSST